MPQVYVRVPGIRTYPTTRMPMNNSLRMDARWWPVREEHLLTIYIHYCESSNKPKTTSFQEGPHQKLFFHLQESEDERRARLDKKI